MALTPLSMLAFEKILIRLDAAPDPDAGRSTFEAVDAEPDIIIAGFGRYGRSPAPADGQRLQVDGADADIEMIDLLRRFGDGCTMATRPVWTCCAPPAPITPGC